MKNLADRYLKEIVANLEKNYRPEKIILFGSYCDGTFTKDSDIDLLIIKNTDKHPIWRRVEARKASKVKIPLDILVYTPKEMEKLKEENSFFIDEILAKGKVLYER